jgi:uncharacterized membrane protein YagU involved in acid resistance
MMIAAQGLGLTRINIPFLLGSMFTPDRDRAKLIGFAVHLVNGWLFSLGYVWLFDEVHRATWWLGALLGLTHGVFALVILTYLLPGMHPRMASEQRGPTVVRRLEPPGFLAIHYGYPTPVSVVLAHIVFGGLLGGSYQLP